MAFLFQWHNFCAAQAGIGEPEVQRMSMGQRTKGGQERVWEQTNTMKVSTNYQGCTCKYQDLSLWAYPQINQYANAEPAKMGAHL